jgi:hypothetical protein
MNLRIPRLEGFVDCVLEAEAAVARPFSVLARKVRQGDGGMASESRHSLAL